MILVPSQRDKLTLIKHKIDKLKLLELRESCQDSLRYFVEKAWPVIDPSPFMANWAIDAICDHLEAVMLGHIPKLLINVPPRCSKTRIVSIMYPAWTWLRFHDISPLSGPQVRFLTSSYSDKLTWDASNDFRRLVESEWYTALNPDLQLAHDQNTKGRMDNNKKGSRQSTSVSGTLIGLGGNILIGDDLNKTDDDDKIIETGADRKKAAKHWDEMRSTRRNDPREGHYAVINVQQRVNNEDVSGHWLSNDDGIVHLMIPMRHDPSRHCVTIKLPQYDADEPWEDPRDPESEELMWPERFGEFEVRGQERALGPIAAAGRLQQSPKAKGGNILQRDWWVSWDERTAVRYGLEWSGSRRELPYCDLVVASLDTAYKEKEENDYNAFTVWGIFQDLNRNRRAILMYAWAKRCPLNGTEVYPYPNEMPVVFEERRKKSWGLVDWIADTCKRYKVKRLLIEDKARGHDVANELKRLHGRDNWGVQLCTPVVDKVSRAHATVPLFTDQAIYAPVKDGLFLSWAESVITQCEEFPKAAHDDYVDTVTQFLLWARENEILVRVEEEAAAMAEEAMFKGNKKTVQELYGV